MALDAIRFVVALAHKFPDETKTAIEQERSQKTLLFLLESLMGINTLYLRQYPNTAPIYAKGMVKYQPENGTEEWLSLPVLLARGVGDCEDLAAARGAELRVAGVEVEGYLDWRDKGNGTKMYHALVGRKTIDDFLPPGRPPRTPEEKVTSRGERVLVCTDDGRPVLWMSKVQPGWFVEDPSRMLGMGKEIPK